MYKTSDISDSAILFLQEQLYNGKLIPDKIDYGCLIDTFHSADGVFKLIHKEYKHYPVWVCWYELTYKNVIKKYSEDDYMRIICMIAYYYGWRYSPIDK